MQKLIVTDLVTKGGAVIAAVGHKEEVWAKVHQRRVWLPLEVLYETESETNFKIKSVEFLNDPPLFIILGDEREIELPEPGSVDAEGPSVTLPNTSGEVRVSLK